MITEGMYRSEGDIVQFTAGAAYTAGEIITLLDGRAAMVSSTVASGDLASAVVRGVVQLTKTSGAIVAGQNVLWDTSNNYVSASGTLHVGMAVAAAASGDTTVSVALNERSGSAAIGALIAVVKTVTGAGTVPVFTANCPTKYRVVNFYIIATNTTNGTVKLTDGTNDITNAITHGTTDNAIEAATTIYAAYCDIAAGGTLNIVAATGGNSIAVIHLVAV